MSRDSLLQELAADPRLPRRVVEAFERVPRERFVPEAWRSRAWDDGALPIEEGQTVSQPSLVGLMMAEAGVTPDSRVLEIGTGSGYQTALLAELLGLRAGGDRGEGFLATIERLPGLASSAKKLLDELGYEDIRYHVGDGALGRPELAPFDAIIVTAAAGRVPEPLREQLAVGGRLVIPVGGPDMQQLLVITRSVDGETTQRGPWVRFVPLLGS